MIHTLRGRIAAFLAVCVATVVCTSCSIFGLGGNQPTTGPEPSTGVATAPTESASPTAASSPVVDDPLPGHPEAEPSDKPYTLTPRHFDEEEWNDIPGLSIDGSDRFCHVNVFDYTEHNITTFGETVVYNDGKGDVRVTTAKSSTGLTLTISPNTSYYGGWFNDNSPFLIPREAGPNDGNFLSSVFFPAKTFGEAKKAQICVLGEPE